MTVLPRGICGALAASSILLGCSLDDRTLTATDRDAARPVDADAPQGSAVDGLKLVACTGIPVREALIADFSVTTVGADGQTDDNGDPHIDFHTGDQGFGGGSFVYHALVLPDAAVALAIEPKGDGKILHVTANPGIPISEGNAWFGFGFGIGYSDEGGCLDASQFEGIQFTLVGSLGTCKVTFGVDFSEDTFVGYSTAGACSPESECVNPQSRPLAPGDGGLVKVAFDEMAEGKPLTTVNRKTVMNIKWAFSAPMGGAPCVADFTIDDVAFF